MDQTLLWLHPVMQVFALLLGIFAMWQGMQRVAMNHFKKKIIFQWKSHVRWGSLVMILWIAGAFGFYVTHAVFGETHIGVVDHRVVRCGVADRGRDGQAQEKTLLVAGRTRRPECFAARPCAV